MKTRSEPRYLKLPTNSIFEEKVYCFEGFPGTLFVAQVTSKGIKVFSSETKYSAHSIEYKVEHFLKQHKICEALPPGSAFDIVGTVLPVLSADSWEDYGYKEPCPESRIIIQQIFEVADCNTNRPLIRPFEGAFSKDFIKETIFVPLYNTEPIALEDLNSTLVEVEVLNPESVLGSRGFHSLVGYSIPKNPLGAVDLYTGILTDSEPIDEYEVNITKLILNFTNTALNASTINRVKSTLESDEIYKNGTTKHKSLRIKDALLKESAVDMEFLLNSVSTAARIAAERVLYKDVFTKIMTEESL